ncbi:SIR2 family protein [Stenotrophomonas maltophilia]|uniref:SIR2 family protein n=1 Tax=Stenotrophomonas maltophilia TaxID=40324 RepID=UPI001559121A|nr:SIR2 family protein [Stenotrophomonas maltophilia]
MPRFIKNGPVVPDQLVQDLEDDRVVIFCGAGVSMAAGLPSYIGLVEHCYLEQGRELPAKKSLEWTWPDRMLGDLEGTDRASPVRKHVIERLNAEPKHLEMHKAIIRLARLRRSEGLRLVTTNYDHFFELASSDQSIPTQYHSAPVLPVPRSDVGDSWKSIVYLHGRLEDPVTGNGHLVLTSADFGKAYLTEGWAARFVTRLFADFTVLFLGYSLNDPVLRYMTDAFAAERASARSDANRSSAYIFVPYRGRKAPDHEPYRNRRLEPVFYNEYRHHSRLQKTIVAWAKARDNFLVSNSVLIKRIAPKDPRTLDPSDTANLLWAILGRRDDSGHGARVFARLPSPAPIEWFDEFERVEHERCEVHAALAEAAKTAGTAIPAAPDLPCGSLFPAAADSSDAYLSETARGLLKWLSRHLGSQGLVDRVIARLGRGRRLHRQLKTEIRSNLGSTNVLGRGYVRFWQIVSADGQWSGAPERPFPFLSLPPGNDSFSMQWWKQEILSGLQPTLRMKPPYPTGLLGLESGSGTERHEPGNLLREVAEAEISLCGDSTIDSLISTVNKHHGGGAFWARLIPELTHLLVQTLELYQIVSDAGPLSDPVVFKRPSIVPNTQNRYYDRWTHLIDFIWLGWSHLSQQDSNVAEGHLQVWGSLPYPTFERLTLAGLKNQKSLPARKKLEFLLKEGTTRLWGSSTRKETFDLLVALWPTLSTREREQLAMALLAGPDPVPGSSDDRRDRSIFDRLALLERGSDGPLPEALVRELQRIRTAYPLWKIQEGERAHFSMYRAETSRKLAASPEEPSPPLVADGFSSLLSLREHENEDHEDLRGRVIQSAKDDYVAAISALRIASRQEDAVSTDVWLYSLQALREAVTDPDDREMVLHVLIEMPQPSLQMPSISSAAADLLEAAVRSNKQFDDDVFWTAYDRVLNAAALDHRNSDHVEAGEDWVSLAINRSMGILATALLNVAFSKRLSAANGLPDPIKSRMDKFIHPLQSAYRPARIIVASRLSYLFAVDPAWTSESLIPLLDWSNELESASAWEGFAWQAALDEQLWGAIKPSVFSSFSHQRANRLHRHASRTIAQILPLAGIEFSLRETPSSITKTALRQMTDEMRQAVASWISEFMEVVSTSEEDRKQGASNRVDLVWTKQVAPWIRSVWPTEPTLRSVGVGKRMALAAICTRSVFAAAVAEVKHHFVLCPANSVLTKLAASDHPTSSPKATLELMDALVERKSTQYDMTDLRSILSRLSEGGAHVTTTAAYLRWREYVDKQL